VIGFRVKVIHREHGRRQEVSLKVKDSFNPGK